MSARPWDVFNGNGDHVNTVWFDSALDEEAVLRLLISRCGYATDIWIFCADIETVDK